MKKTPSLFKRDYGGRRELLREVVPGSEWVLRGEGTPTRKYNGTCCLVEGGDLYRRYDAKLGRTPPAGFRPAQPDPDPVTGHWPGWLPVTAVDAAARYHREAWAHQAGLPDGTYELIGPKVQGGADADLHGGRHLLIRHGAHPLGGVPRDFDGLRGYLRQHPDWEGVVWHHPDGRKVKITHKGFTDAPQADPHGL
ncbi:hypothetical protein D3875_03960 [Deinococcus cavernae]|uniref:Uncharacterized protein n=1 Tax=Deinococcus cavernae TaxID=2320857 RepID=A0A418VEB1_9DEIO|nr:hypothetical protein [Deinococcus cavernae]RJF74441.1 hypothetical protein D3875_03960 [Deinococcus cavernae]